MNIIIHGKLARAGGDRYLHVFAMELTGPEQWKELVDSVDTFIFDCDGKQNTIDLCRLDLDRLPLV